MNNRIEQIIDEIEDYIESCKPKFMSSTEIIVNKDTLDELLQELRMKTPEEIRQYQKIINNKDAILNDARSKAAELINKAAVQTNELVNEHEIMQQAYSQANEIVAMATQQAQGIVDNAAVEANNVRAAAMQYMEDVLSHLENIIVSSAQTATNNYEALIGNLNHYKDIIQSNRKELHPTDEPDSADNNNENAEGHNVDS